jgi:GGDEF domain-containing protein
MRKKADTSVVTQSTPAVEQQDRESSLGQTAMNCYMTTVLAIADCFAQICPDIGIPYQERLQRVPRRLGFNPTPKALEESRLALLSDLRDFAHVIGQYLNAIPTKADEIVAMAVQASELLNARIESHNALMQGLAEQMETAAEVDDPGQIRGFVAQQAVGLRTSSESVNREIASLLGRLRAEAEAFQRNLRQADELMTMDRVTALLNRRGVERHLESDLAAGKQFCVLMFQSDAPAGLSGAEKEQLIKKLATNLAAQVRPSDVVCRWDEDRFLVIFQCGMKHAEARSRQIAQGMGERFVSKADGKEQKLSIQVHVTLLEPETNETAEGLYQRIDKTTPRP